jgi:hypothetical protein
MQWACIQVAILPIFWNQRPEEKAMVIKCCERAAELLEAADMSCHVDKNSHLTPGQRMRRWCALPAAGVSCRNLAAARAHLVST